MVIASFQIFGSSKCNVRDGNRNLKWGRSDEMFTPACVRWAIFQLTYWNMPDIEPRPRILTREALGGFFKLTSHIHFEGLH